ncbi:MAG: beta-ketoacyl-ACP synthase 3 [Planctomycetota bacterium]
MTPAFRIGYLGHGAYVPPTVLSNEDLATFVDTSDEWIQRRTGIRTRHVLAGDESILEMAVEASRRALDRAGLEPGQIDDIRVGVSTWMRLPSLATQVQKTLGVGSASASDISAGCAGFVYAVEEAWQKIVFERLLYGRETHALAIGVDGLSHITDWNDRSTCVLLGDGAGAVVVGEVEHGGILATHTHADGNQGHLLYSETPPPDPAHVPERAPRVHDTGGRQYLRMDGRRVFGAAVQTMVSDVKMVLAKYAKLSGRRVGVEDIDFLFPHQANVRILEMVAKRLGVPIERVYTDGIAKYGNTSAASIPLGYEDMRYRFNGSPHPRLEVDVAFGSGFASGAILREVP